MAEFSIKDLPDNFLALGRLLRDNKYECYFQNAFTDKVFRVLVIHEKFGDNLQHKYLVLDCKGFNYLIRDSGWYAYPDSGLEPNYNYLVAICSTP
jgi:hypothetical protein